MDIVPSVCPHDCTSTCALEVERIDAGELSAPHLALVERHGAAARDLDEAGVEWLSGIASMVLPLPMRMASLDAFVTGRRGGKRP